MREREESSQVPCALGLIETSANIERCSGREPVFVHPNEALPPSFIDQGGENYTCRTSTGLPFSLRSRGEQWLLLSLSAVEYGVGYGRRPCESFACVQGVSASCGASRWRGGDRGMRSALRQMR